MKRCTSNAVDGTNDDMLWNDSEVDRKVMSARKVKALTVKMESDSDL
jgi:hypothetical protein